MLGDKGGDYYKNWTTLKADAVNYWIKAWDSLVITKYGILSSLILGDYLAILN